MKRSGVLLDIDGTLLDTNYLHTLAWWRAFQEVGHTVPMWRIHPLIGMGGDMLVPELIGHTVEGTSEAYGRHFEQARQDAAPLPGARELVRALAEAGLVVVLASSARKEDLEHFRSVLAIDEWVAGATSSGDVERSKPDDEVFAVAMASHGLERPDTIAIGDAVWDGEAAARRGVEFVAVESGGTPAARLRAAGATAVYPDAAALLADLRSGPLARLLPD